MDRVIDMNSGSPPIIITSTSDEELINLRQYILHFKLGQKTFKYYFQIIKNLKRDLILGLNFQRMFKISQDITADDNDLYLHIRNNIVTVTVGSDRPKNLVFQCMLVLKFFSRVSIVLLNAWYITMTTSIEGNLNVQKVQKKCFLLEKRTI